MKNFMKTLFISSLVAWLGLFSSYAMARITNCDPITANQPVFVDPPGIDDKTGYSLDYASVVFTKLPDYGTVQMGHLSHMIYIPNTRGIVKDNFSYVVLDAYGYGVFYHVKIKNRCHVELYRTGRQEESF